MRVRLNVVVVMALALLPVCARGEQESLGHVKDVREMSAAAAARSMPVRIRGVVTALSGWKNSFFLQDEGGGVSVDRTDSAEVRAGDMVEVTGVTGAGLFAPIVQAQSVRVLPGHSQLAPARRVEYGEFSGGKLDSERIEIHGVVRSAKVASSWGRRVLFLEIDAGGGTITARVLEFPQGGFTELVDATVNVTGVLGTIFNEKRQFLGARLFVPRLEAVSVQENGAADPFAVAESSMAKLLQFDPAQKFSHRVRISGVLTGERGGRTLYLQDANQGIVVKTEQPVHFAIGSRVEAVGFLVGSESSPALQNSVVRLTGRAALPQSLAVAASQIIQVKEGFTFAPASGLLVRVEGDIIKTLEDPDEQIWILRDGNRVFQAQLEKIPGVARSSTLADGSRVRVQGICVVETGADKDPQSFRVLLRTPQDMEVLRAPVLTTDRLAWLAAAMVIVSIWVLLVAFQVKRPATEKQPEARVLPNRMHPYCHRAARAAGLINVGIGVLVFFGGWILNIPGLRNLAEGYSAMRPLTALGLIFLGLALYLDREDEISPLRRRSGYICASLTVLIGLLPLLEYGAHQDLHLTELLVPRQVAALAPGHMAFLTALNFVMLGSAILLSRSSRGFAVAQYLAVVAGSFSLFNAIGFLYGIRSFYGLTFNLGPVFSTAMAIHTAVSMVILSAGVMFSRPRWGLMIPVMSSAPGGVMARRLLPCALIFPAAVGWLRMQGQTHGFYDGTFGLTLFASTNIVIFMFLVWGSSSLLNRLDVERSRAERHLRESEESFRRLAEAMPQIVWTTTADGRVEYFNQRWYDYTGMTVQQSKDWGWTPVLHPEDLETCIAQWTMAVQTVGQYEIEYRFKRADGKYRWQLGRGVPVLDDNGNVLRWFGTCTDIEDQKRAQISIRQLNETLEGRVQQRTAALAGANKELGDTRAKLQGVLDAATQISIIATDVNGMIRIFNTGAERMLQYASKEVEGVCNPAIFHDPAECEQRALELSRDLGRDVRGFEVFVAEARMGRYVAREWTYIRKDGSTLDVSLVVTAVRNEVGDIQGFLGIGTDITARKRLERNLLLNNEQLVEQTRRAEEANRIKGEFLAAMSHEIRTPMNAILGMADLLWESELDPDQLQYVEVFRRAGANLLTLINEILDLSKIEAGQLELEHIPFDLEDVVRSSIELTSMKARVKGLALMSRLAPSVETALVGDPARLRQILINLLGNAVKFTDAGEILLTVENPEETRSGFVKFSITDTGIGIPVEKLETIFEDFTQGDASITRRFGGTGLGLGISRRLAQQMGGEIGVTSSERGSTFHFSLNFEVSPRDRHDKIRNLADLHGQRVLILDDNATNRLILRETLSFWGLESVEFARPQEALTHLLGEHERYALAIVDNHMPEMNGFQAAARIVKAVAGLPVVMLTSDNQPGDASRGRQAGLAGYAVKPVKRADLFRLVCDAMKKRTPQIRNDRDAPAGQPTHSERQLRILVAEDSHDNCLLIQAYLKGTPHILTFVGDGLEVLTAFAAGPFDIVLMDIQMPVMDGFTATRALRQTEKEKSLKTTPILALSANARAEDIAQSHAAGCTAHLSKPISKSRLLRALETYAPTRGRAESEAVLIQMPEGLEDLIPEYLRSRRKELPEALELLATSYFERLRITGHNWKGSGSSYGFEEISIIGAALEESAEQHDVQAATLQLEALANYLRRVELGSVC